MKKEQLLNHFKIKDKLKFDYKNCRIRLDKNRMVLLHADALASLHSELFDQLGCRQAQGILLRMGFASGQLDAEVALAQHGKSNDKFDVFDLGPALHGLEGLVNSDIVEHTIDWEQGRFYGRVECRESVEAETYLARHSKSDCPVCWSVVGYASGYSSHFFKRFIVFKETHCRACGDEFCQLIGKPAEDWDDDDNYNNYFKTEKEQTSSNDGHLRQPLCSDQLDQGNLLGKSQAFQESFSLIQQASKTPINVLLQGETGVGKEVFARWLHDNSERKDKPFVAINCGAIPNDLIEAELFGVKRGAFTGASESRPGRFEVANGGTLFLDELGELSRSAQVKLLRVLQTGELERVGDTKTIQTDVRLVAATNVDLHTAIEEGEFRSDLFYRVATYPVKIPPLRDRQSDIPILANAFIEEYAPLYKKNITGISSRALHTLMSYQWPGNIRELQNVIERAILLAQDNTEIGQIIIENGPAKKQTNIPAYLEQTEPVQIQDNYASLVDTSLTLQEHEREILKTALEKTNGNITKAAKILGITRRQFSYKLNA